MVAICFENRLAMATKPSTSVVIPRPTGISVPPMRKLNGNLVFLVVPVIAQHQHAQRLQEEAPHHAEGVGFAEQVDVAAAAARWSRSAAARSG